MQFMTRRYNSGFTLVELLIVVVIFSMISFTLYSTFSNGIKIWQKIDQEIPEEDINIFLEKFSTDLRNAFKFTGLFFIGKRDRIEFNTLVNSARLKKRTVGKIAYSYNNQEEAFLRSQLDFSQLSTGSSEGIEQSLKNVNGVVFLYYFQNSQTKEYMWTDEWAAETLPLAVRIDLWFGYDEKRNKFSKTIGIPAGG
jgi:prepilin-type N-terminal cleavage/methylation domain-containing protein